jgi:hypothetical protein
MKVIMWRNNCMEVNNKVQEDYLFWFHWNIYTNGHIKNYEALLFSTPSYFMEIQKSWKKSKAVKYFIFTDASLIYKYVSNIPQNFMSPISFPIALKEKHAPF